MARTLLVVPTAAGASLARTCLGVVRALDRQGVNVGFVKPVAQPRPDGGPDRSAALVAAITSLRPPDPVSTAQLEQQLGSGGLDVVLEKAVAIWQPVHDQYDVVVVEGLTPGPAKLYASGLNQALKETTATFDYKLSEGFLMRYEWRRDFSNQPSFLTSTQNVLSKEQNTATLGLIWWWGNKEGAW